MNTSDDVAPPEPALDVKGSTVWKLVFLVCITGAAAAVYWRYSHLLSLEYLVERESFLKDYLYNYHFRALGIALFVYIAVTGFSLPGAAVMTLVFGWYFGFWEALVAVSFGSSIGATLAFLMSRFLLGGWVQNRFGSKLKTMNDALDREGAFYLFSLRLVPVFPFFVVNLLMGLTKIRTRTFWWVSQLGMLPGTIAYVYAGSNIPSLQDIANHGPGRIISWQVLVAFAILGIFPLVAKKVIVAMQHKSNEEVPS